MRGRIGSSFTRVDAAICLLVALVVGAACGVAIAVTGNIRSLDVYARDRPALPTRILDRNGRLITEFFRDQKREIIRVEDISPHLIQALLTREDRHFFRHPGFRIPDTVRAAWNMVSGRFWSGGSTITQQLAGSVYADRTEITIRRKLVELWWAIQLERWLTKNEILQRYLNLVYFGEGTYGVEAASQFYFKHSARDMSVAEAAMLVIQLNRPGGNSPINHPNRARTLQRENPRPDGGARLRHGRRRRPVLSTVLGQLRFYPVEPFYRLPGTRGRITLLQRIRARPPGRVCCSVRWTCIKMA